MHPALLQQAHRPWPVPARPWVWRQAWCDLLFAHWPVSRAVLQRFVPEALQVQEHEGSAWLGIVPFRMEGVMRRALPDMPFVSAFPELNVRTYVEFEGKPGVWFFSLDATSALAVWAAQTFFHLPYRRAEISVEAATDGDAFAYRSQRVGASEAFEATYGPTSERYLAQAGTLEHFLTERYCLYAQAPGGALFRTEVQHAQWPLQRARARIGRNTLVGSYGIDVSGEPAHLHFARRIEVVAWSPQRVG